MRKIHMNKKNQDFKELIYNLMMGTYNLQEYFVKESQYIQNEFENEKFCNQAYEQIFYANRRICDRLNENEDKDVECIISNFFEITHHLCMKMYDYGVLNSQRNGNLNIEKTIIFYSTLPEKY